MEAQGFPVINQPFVDERGYVTQSWRQLLVFLWKQLGAGGGNAGTLLVNPGTGDNTRELNVALADYANVNDYLNVGDTHYDGAIARALSDKGKAYFPAKPYLTNPGEYYRIVDTVLLSSGQALIGDGAGTTKLVSETGNKPVITLGENMYWFHISGMTIAHVDNPVVAGGDGIYQGQGLTDWVDNALMEDLLVIQNYHGLNLGKAYKGTIRDVFSNGNLGCGFYFVTTGNATVNGVPVGGPLQWVLDNCAAQANTSDGYAYTVTGTGHGGFGAGTSVGTITNCVSFANGGHGISMIGTAAQPIQGVRIEGGFFGEDAGEGIYMDTYGYAHALRPLYLELAGGSNIYLTANNFQTMIALGECVGAWNDGITSIGAIDTVVTGGVFRNNGLAGNMGVGATWAGIRIDGGSAQINSVRCLDSGAGIQSYGISVTGDDVIICGSRLTDNAIGPIVWATGPVNSIVTGCLPTTANTGLGDIQVNSIGVGMAPTGITGQLSVAGAAGISGGLTIAAGGLTLTAAVPGNFITTDDITVNRSIGVGTGASGSTGRIDTTGNVNVGGNLAVTGTVGALSMSGGINMNNFGISNMGSSGGSGGMTMNGGFATSSSISGANLSVTNSIGVGTAASGTAGRIDLTSGIYLNGTMYNNP